MPGHPARWPPPAAKCDDRRVHLLAAWAATLPTGFTMPMLLGPETKGLHLVSDVVLAPGAQPLPRTGAAD